jgi:hypothetical protein
MGFDPFKKERERRWPRRAPPKNSSTEAKPGGEAGMPLFLREAVLTPVGPGLQRFPREGGAAPSAAESAPPEGYPASEASPDAATSPTQAPSAAVTPALGLIVDDSMAVLAAGQMTKSQFLAQLNGAVCAAAEQALSGTIWSAVGCPWVDHWFRYYAGRSAQDIERAIVRYSPEASGAKTTGELIVILCGRVRNAIATWSATGEVTDALQESGVGAPESSPVSGAVPPQPGMLFKRDGAAGGLADSGAARAQLGAGRSLDAGVRTRMESALGRDFSKVRVHTGEDASHLSDAYGARAFTVSDHIAFGRGEYLPGTPVGDALIAHELAHVVQQEGASSSSASAPQVQDDPRAEQEADFSALRAVTTIFGGTGAALSDFARRGIALTRSGLRLQRCKSGRQKEIERLAGVQAGFLEDKRKKEEEEQRKAAEEAAKKAGDAAPKVDVHVDVDDVLKKEVAKGAIPGGPDAEWTGLAKADQDDWTNRRAPAAWAAVVASVKGTELEKVMDGWSPAFEPQVALSKGYYAWSVQDQKTFHFGMSWVKNVEADPKNVWPNVAHEIGGHHEYGTPYANEIMNEVLSNLPAAERKKWQDDPALSQQFYENYSYPETEIYSEIRARRYSNPEAGPAPVYGGMKPDDSVPYRLKIMKDALAPEVAKAVLYHLKAKIDANPEILPRDKKFFPDQVKAVFGYDL